MVAITVILSALSFSSHADLVNEGNYITDTDTNLEWAMPNRFKAQTKDELQINLDTNFANKNFRLATNAEVVQLTTNFLGYAPVSPGYSYSNTLFNFVYYTMGATTGGSQYPRLRALTSDGRVDMYPNANKRRTTEYMFSVHETDYYDSMMTGSSGSITGYFLVSDNAIVSNSDNQGVADVSSPFIFSSLALFGALALRRKK
jgi:hypothetical protein